MFSRNDPAMPWGYAEVGGGSGLTKFEQCAKDFTAAALPYLLAHYQDQRDGTGWQIAERVAAEIGLDAAEELCRQMERDSVATGDTAFIQHIQQHLEPGQEVVCKICGKTAREIIGRSTDENN